MNEGTAVLCEDLHFQYETQSSPVLTGLNIEIQKGDFIVVAGPSGEGKSTFCRTLNNIIPLFYKGSLSGKRWVAGEWLAQQAISSIARKVGMVFQDFEQQLFSTSALLELSFGLENFAISQKEMHYRLNSLIEKFGLSRLVAREPFSLSGGEKQKLAIASVLAYKPEILVLDEPITDLDPESREFVLQVLPKLKDWVDTIVVVEHETEYFKNADRVFLFREGQIKTSGTPSEILTQSQLLMDNSLAPLDSIRIQEALGMTPSVLPLETLAASLKNYELKTIPSQPRADSPVAIQARNLTFQYEGQTSPALDNVSFEIRKGEFVGIIGQNGSGKSTLLKHLNGLQLPHKGTVEVLNKATDKWNRQELAMRVGLVFQNPDHQIFSGSVREEVEFGPRRFGFSDEKMKTNADRAIETMDLQRQVERDPFQLSKGERQRVAVASVLSVNPEILILDEPTTGLDSRQQRYLMDLLRDFHKTGITVIAVTHSWKLVAEYCNYALLLSAGKLVAEGHPRDVFFKDDIPMKLPPILELSRFMKGNALTVDEFIVHLALKG